MEDKKFQQHDFQNMSISSPQFQYMLFDLLMQVIHNEGKITFENSKQLIKNLQDYLCHKHYLKYKKNLNSNNLVNNSDSNISESQSNNYDICMNLLLILLASYSKINQNFSLFIIENFIEHMNSHLDCFNYLVSFYRLYKSSPQVKLVGKDIELYNFLFEIYGKIYQISLKYELNDKEVIIKKDKEGSENKYFLENFTGHLTGDLDKNIHNKVATSANNRHIDRSSESQGNSQASRIELKNQKFQIYNPFKSQQKSIIPSKTERKEISSSNISSTGQKKQNNSEIFQNQVISGESELNSKNNKISFNLRLPKTDTDHIFTLTRSSGRTDFTGNATKKLQEKSMILSSKKQEESHHLEKLTIKETLSDEKEMSATEKLKTLAVQLGESCLAGDLSYLINQKRDLELEKIAKDRIYKRDSLTNLRKTQEIGYVEKLKLLDKIESYDETNLIDRKKEDESIKKLSLNKNHSNLVKIEEKASMENNSILKSSQNLHDITNDFKHKYTITFENNLDANIDKNFKIYCKIRELLSNFILSCLQEYHVEELHLLKINFNLIFLYSSLPSIDQMRKRIEKKKSENFDYLIMNSEFDFGLKHKIAEGTSSLIEKNDINKMIDQLNNNIENSSKSIVSVANLNESFNKNDENTSMSVKSEYEVLYHILCIYFSSIENILKQQNFFKPIYKSVDNQEPEKQEFWSQGVRFIKCIGLTPDKIRNHSDGFIEKIKNKLDFLLKTYEFKNNEILWKHIRVQLTNLKDYIVVTKSRIIVTYILFFFTEIFIVLKKNFIVSFSGIIGIDLLKPDFKYDKTEGINEYQISSEFLELFTVFVELISKITELSSIYITDKLINEIFMKCSTWLEVVKFCVSYIFNFEFNTEKEIKVQNSIANTSSIRRFSSKQSTKLTIINFQKEIELKDNESLINTKIVDKYKLYLKYAFSLINYQSICCLFFQKIVRMENLDKKKSDEIEPTKYWVESIQEYLKFLYYFLNSKTGIFYDYILNYGSFIRLRTKLENSSETITGNSKTVNVPLNFLLTRSILCLQRLSYDFSHDLSIIVNEHTSIDFIRLHYISFIKLYNKNLDFATKIGDFDKILENCQDKKKKTKELIQQIYKDTNYLNLIISLCKSHLKCLFNLAKHRDADVTNKFYQLRILEVLVRELDLEHEAHENASKLQKYYDSCKNTEKDYQGRSKNGTNTQIREISETNSLKQPDSRKESKYSGKSEEFFLNSKRNESLSEKERSSVKENFTKKIKPIDQNISNIEIPKSINEDDNNNIKEKEDRNETQSQSTKIVEEKKIEDKNAKFKGIFKNRFKKPETTTKIADQEAQKETQNQNEMDLKTKIDTNQEEKNIVKSNEDINNESNENTIKMNLQIEKNSNKNTDLEKEKSNEIPTKQEVPKNEVHANSEPKKPFSFKGIFNKKKATEPKKEEDLKPDIQQNENIQQTKLGINLVKPDKELTEEDLEDINLCEKIVTKSNNNPQVSKLSFPQSLKKNENSNEIKTDDEIDDESIKEESENNDADSFDEDNEEYDDIPLCENIKRVAFPQLKRLDLPHTLSDIGLGGKIEEKKENSKLQQINKNSNNLNKPQNTNNNINSPINSVSPINNLKIKSSSISDNNLSDNDVVSKDKKLNNPGKLNERFGSNKNQIVFNLNLQKKIDENKKDHKILTDDRSKDIDINIKDINKIDKSLRKHIPKIQVILEKMLKKKNAQLYKKMQFKDITEEDLLNTNLFYQKERSNRLLYHDSELQILIISIITCLILTPTRGTLDALYCSEYPLENGKINILFLLHHHLNHPDNRNILPSLLSTLTEINPFGSGQRLMKLICKELFDLSLFKSWSKVESGAYGTVYQCSTNIEEPASVAIKQMPVSEGIYDSCKIIDIFTEVTALEKFRMEGCVTHLFDYGVDDDSYYIIMKMYPSSVKSWRLQQKGNLNEMLPIYLNIYRDILKAISIIHNYDTTHYDIKCDNILIDYQNSDLSPRSPISSNDENAINVKIADFGECKVFTDEQDELCTRNRGTEYIKSPEMLNLGFGYRMDDDKFDRRKKIGTSRSSDIWSLGCLFYELLTGKFLFEEETNDYFAFIKKLNTGNINELLTPEKVAELNNNVYLIDFLKFVLVRDPQSRPNINTIRSRYNHVHALLVSYGNPYSSKCLSSFSKRVKRNIEYSFDVCLKLMEEVETNQSSAQHALFLDYMPNIMKITEDIYVADLNYTEANMQKLIKLGITHIFTWNKAKLKEYSEKFVCFNIFENKADMKKPSFYHIHKTIDFLRHCMVYKGKTLFIDDFQYTNTKTKQNFLVRHLIILIVSYVLNLSAYDAWTYINSKLLFFWVPPEDLEQLSLWVYHQSYILSNTLSYPVLKCFCGGCCLVLNRNFLDLSTIDIKPCNCSKKNKNTEFSDCPSQSCFDYIQNIHNSYGINYGFLQWGMFNSDDFYVGPADCTNFGSLKKMVMFYSQCVDENSILHSTNEKKQNKLVNKKLYWNLFKCKICHIWMYAENNEKYFVLLNNISNTQKKVDRKKKLLKTSHLQNLKLSNLLQVNKS